VSDARVSAEIAGLSLQELCAEATREALDDAGLRASDVDAVFVQIPIGRLDELVGYLVSHASDFQVGEHELAEGETARCGFAKSGGRK
jgi:hypothetical protein